MKLPRPPSFEDPYQTPSDDMLKAIGYVVVAAAGPEDLLHALFWKLAKLTGKNGSIITKDMRPSRMAEDIVKLAKTTKYNDKRLTALQDILSDLK